MRTNSEFGGFAGASSPISSCLLTGSAFNCFSSYLTDIFEALMMNTQISLAESPQLGLIRTRWLLGCRSSAAQLCFLHSRSSASLENVRNVQIN